MQNEGSRPAVFMDRDNTLIEDPGYLRDPNQVHLLAGVAPALKGLRQAGFAAVVVTNQSGIARGYLTEKELAAVHDRMKESLRAEGAEVDAIYYCPYFDGPAAVVEQYRRRSHLRKPAPGMLLKAAAEHNLRLSESWMIGDSERDIEAGRSAGCRTILIGDQRTAMRIHADYSAADLAGAAQVILKQQRKSRLAECEPVESETDPREASPKGHEPQASDQDLHEAGAFRHGPGESEEQPVNHDFLEEENLAETAIDADRETAPALAFDSETDNPEPEPTLKSPDPQPAAPTALSEPNAAEEGHRAGDTSHGKSNRMSVVDEVVARSETDGPCVQPAREADSPSGEHTADRESFANSPRGIETSLQEILEELRSMKREQRSTEFSIAHLFGAVMQAIAICAIGWGLYALIDSPQAAGLKFLVGIAFQLLAMTGFLYGRRR